MLRLHAEHATTLGRLNRVQNFPFGMYLHTKKKVDTIFNV